jgi:hypothetical protein
MCLRREKAVKSRKFIQSYFNTKKSYKDIQSSLSRIDTTDAGREQVNAGQQVSPEYILRSDITARRDGI